MTPAELASKLAALPRAGLAHLPTPLEELPRLSAALGGPRVVVKREDCTGLAVGGNKTRQFEYSLGNALSSGADTIVTGAASQSNHCRQAAAACARLGLACHLVLRDDDRRRPVQGNHLLMRLLGANIRFARCELGPEMDVKKEELAEELRAKGSKPYVLSSPCANGPNATGYVGMVVELETQLADRGIRPTWLYICTAGPTGAGILLGAKLLDVSWKMAAIAPIVWPFPAEEKMAEVANSAAGYIGVDLRVKPDDFDVNIGYVGPGYGTFTPEAKEAIELMARTEGIVLDPVYSGKCFAGLVDHVRRGKLSKKDTVVFVHTGGSPALFAYAPEVSPETG